MMREILATEIDGKTMPDQRRTEINGDVAPVATHSW